MSQKESRFYTLAGIKTTIDGCFLVCFLLLSYLLGVEALQTASSKVVLLLY